MGSKNGSSSIYSAIEGTSSYGLAPGYSSYEGSRTIYFPEKSIHDIEKLKGQPYDYMIQRHADHSMITNNSSAAAGVRLSDTHLASRRAEEAATRRQQATLWLQEMVGNLALPSEPTEEDLRLCLRNGIILCRVINKVQPGAVLKVVENPTISNHLDGAQSAYQYFENVRNFLVAVEEMGLPSFEASDLEQGSMSSSSSAKLVDCILALKSYHDWKQGGALGFWRLKSPNHPTGYITKSSKYLNRSKSMNLGSNNSRKKWAIPDQDSPDENSLSCSSSQTGDFPLNLEKDSTAPFHETLPSAPFGEDGSLNGDAEELASNTNPSVSKSTLLQHIGHKFREVLQVKARGMQGLPNATPIAPEGYGGGTFSAMDNAPSQSLLSLINAILGDKSTEEVPLLVEFMLRKVMEEFERHLLTQRKQVTKMRSALKDISVREEKLASQNMVLVTLAAGTQEEIKLYTRMVEKIKLEKERMEEEKRLKDEEADRLLKEVEEKRIAVQVLKNELDDVKQLDQELLLRLENQKKEFEMECKESIDSLEMQLQDSYEKMNEMETNSAREMTSLRLKDTHYQTFLSRQLLEYKDLRLAQLNAKEEVLRMQKEWKNQFTNLEEQLLGMARAATGYHKVLAENRMLYNEVQDLKGNIRVYCRVRPFLTPSPGRQTTIDYIGENGELMLVNPSKPGAKDSRKSFTFNKCFGTTASQEEVFLDTQPLIRSVLDGFNVCIFAYGQTGSGKTFTMSGPNNMTPADWGVNYRALHDLFHITQSRLDVFRYEIGVQMLEIYNEQVRDLLAIDGVQKKLEIRNNSQLNGLNVPDASRMPVRSTEDVLELMKVGQKNRAVGATALNERSSRSHSVLTVHVQGTDLDSGAILRGSLHLVDLAGSERVDRSEATGDRLKEAQHINKSLSALGDVIAALAQKNGHVPYRNSKLTQLLQDSLGGQAKTLMFVHISPDVESFGETVSTLKFAERVSSVELGAARSNKESGEIQSLKDQVALLKDAVAKKDAEIASLQILKERSEKGESNMGVEKIKSRTPKPSPRARRMSTDPTSAQKIRTFPIETGSGTVETRPVARKLPGQPKPPLSLALNTSHDSEDPTEHFVSSSACSPLSSPTEHKGLFEVLEERVHRNGTGTGSGTGNWSPQIHTALKNDNVQLKIKQGSKQQEAVLAHHGEIIMHDMKDLSSSLPTTPPLSSSPPRQEITVKEWQDRFRHSGEESGSSSQEADKQHTYANGGFLLETNGEAGAGHSTGSSQQSLQGISQLKPLLNVASNSQQSSNGYCGPSVQEAMTADRHENRGVINKRSSSLLNDVGLEEHFESDGIFDLRDGYDDGASLFSESGLSVEADLSSSSQVDQNRRVQSSSALPRHERRSPLQTQVPRPPVKGTRTYSPGIVDRKSVVGQTHTRVRRYTNVGVSSSTEKLATKRVSLGANPNSDSELSGSRRVAIGANSSASWR